LPWRHFLPLRPALLLFFSNPDCKRKLNWEKLRKDVEENPDTKLADRAQKFGVRPSAICYALEKIKITRKKKNYVTEKEIDKRELDTIES
jgi:putative transposase